MYKLLLCWRYLCTRYIALASIISVTLGVATMIVVNSVMAGFTHEMQDRLHGILSDVVVECVSLSGFSSDPDRLMAEIREVVGDDLEAMTPTVHVPAMLSYEVRGRWITKQVNLIGIDAATHAQVGDFGKYLLHPENRRQTSFQLREDGYDDRIAESGWGYRRKRIALERAMQAERDALAPSDVGPSDEGDSTDVANPFAQQRPETPQDTFDEMTQHHSGVVLGMAVASVRHRDQSGQVKDYFFCRPGDDVKITFPTAGTPPKAATGTFTAVDLYESKMSEYDSSFVFVPIETLQKLRGMFDPQTGVYSVNSIQLKLKEGVNLNQVRDRLRQRFPADQFPYHIQTWRDMQGPLLAAVQMETTILNILLFLIIAVAGFGILATFFMIVVEKTRDVGILKSLGAPSGGIMNIFLGYGLSLGTVGSGVGMVLGLLFVANINLIAAVLESITGHEVFDQTVYYFQEIPTVIRPFTIGWIVGGAMIIAVLASVLPAIRASRLHPVEALRYE